MSLSNPLPSRRELLKAGMYAVGVSAGLPTMFQRVSLAQRAHAASGDEPHPNRILVVLELAGGNDGLNTVVPYEDDAYHNARRRLAIRKRDVLRLDDHFGLHPSCKGLHDLYHDGQMAIINGCGYPNPNLSHFTAMEWWHTATPHGSDERGWLGRFADAHRAPEENYIVNIGQRQSQAVASGKHSPVVFKDPKRFGRTGTEAQQKVFETFGNVYPTENASLRFVNQISRTATLGAAQVRNACAEYRTLVDYGSDNDVTLDLKKVAAMIAADMPTRIYYLTMGGFDTHASQAGLHQTLLMYMSDAVRGFIADLERIGRAEDVVVLSFSEFGRRVRENNSGGTDHGAAGPMFLYGKRVRGGVVGGAPDLTDLDDGNLKFSTDFRSVYGSVLKQWMGFSSVDGVLGGEFPELSLVG